MRRRLNLLVAAATALVALAFVIPLALQVRVLAAERALRPAELATRTLAPAVALQPDPARTRALVEAAAGSLDGSLGVVLADGTAIGADLPAEIADRLRVEARAGRYPVDGGQLVAVPVATGGGTGVVHALVPDTVLRRGVLPAWLILGVLALVLVAAATALADALARHSLSAMRAVEGAARRIADGDLSARADVVDPPEVKRVADVLGHLAQRVEALLVAEREAAADLSHRLRTPLTPLRIDAEALPDSPERGRLLADVAALESEVSRVIRTFRSRGVGTADAGCDPMATVRDRVAFWGPLAEDQDRRLHVDVPASTEGRGERVALPAEQLAETLDALLGNVFTHTPEGVDLTVSCRVLGDTVAVAVTDAGPGWPEGLDVGQRGATSSDRSTGLGLDIARQAARAAGGELVLDAPPGGGARAELRLPLRSGRRRHTSG